LPACIFVLEQALSVRALQEVVNKNSESSVSLLFFILFSNKPVLNGIILIKGQLDPTVGSQDFALWPRCFTKTSTIKHGLNLNFLLNQNETVF
jgi:hypothetical protein